VHAAAAERPAPVGVLTHRRTSYRSTNWSTAVLLPTRRQRSGRKPQYSRRAIQSLHHQVRNDKRFAPQLFDAPDFAVHCRDNARPARHRFCSRSGSSRPHAIHLNLGRLLVSGLSRTYGLAGAENARRADCTNESDTEGRTRFLRNIRGLRLLQAVPPQSWARRVGRWSCASCSGAAEDGSPRTEVDLAWRRTVNPVGIACPRLESSHRHNDS